MMRFLIVITGYNWENFVKPCFDSIKAQTYKNYAVSIVDDGSVDQSHWSVIDERADNWLFVDSLKNAGTIHARGIAIEHAKKHTSFDVIVLLDGDDRLLPHALETVAKAYQDNPTLLMTYGNYQFNTGEKCPIDINYSDEIHAHRNYRQDVFRCTHLRTFRRELYQAVPKWDYTKSEIESYPDAELLFSMMEMAGKDRIGVIQEPIYIYNTDNPLNTLKRYGKDNAGYNEIISRQKKELIK